MNQTQTKQNIEERIKAGLLDDILARIDAEYANYKQTPVFTCQEEELAFWSRTAPVADGESPAHISTQQPNQ